VLDENVPHISLFDVGVRFSRSLGGRMNEEGKGTKLYAQVSSFSASFHLSTPVSSTSPFPFGILPPADDVGKCAKKGKGRGRNPRRFSLYTINT